MGCFQILQVSFLNIRGVCELDHYSEGSPPHDVSIKWRNKTLPTLFMEINADPESIMTKTMFHNLNQLSKY